MKAGHAPLLEAIIAARGYLDLEMTHGRGCGQVYSPRELSHDFPPSRLWVFSKKHLHFFNQLFHAVAGKDD
jgi:hypothetical protein